MNKQLFLNVNYPKQQSTKTKTKLVQETVNTLVGRHFLKSADIFAQKIFAKFAKK